MNFTSKMPYKDVAYILNYKQNHFIEKYFCTWTTGKEEHEPAFYLKAQLKLPIYILLFIPVHFIDILYCVWNCGLRNFSIESRIIKRTYFYIFDKDKPNSQMSRYVELGYYNNDKIKES